MDVMNIIVTFSYFILLAMLILGVFTLVQKLPKQKPIALLTTVTSAIILTALFAIRYLLPLPSPQIGFIEGSLTLATYLFACTFSIRAAYLAQAVVSKALFAVATLSTGVVFIYLAARILL